MNARGATLACPACRVENRPHRGYCRECAAPLQPVCRGCRFVNERGDRFCGGCGLGLAGELVVARAPSGSVREAPPVVIADELAELFAPVADDPTASSSLPSAGITQDDLDRLFGGGT